MFCLWKANWATGQWWPFLHEDLIFRVYDNLGYVGYERLHCKVSCVRIIMWLGVGNRRVLAVLPWRRAEPSQDFLSAHFGCLLQSYMMVPGRFHHVEIRQPVGLRCLSSKKFKCPIFLFFIFNIFIYKYGGFQIKFYGPKPRQKVEDNFKFLLINALTKLIYSSLNS